MKSTNWYSHLFSTTVLTDAKYLPRVSISMDRRRERGGGARRGGARASPQQAHPHGRRPLRRGRTREPLGCHAPKDDAEACEEGVAVKPEQDRGRDGLLVFRLHVCAVQVGRSARRVRIGVLDAAYL